MQPLLTILLVAGASPPLSLSPPRTTRPIMANDVFHEAMRQMPKLLASRGLEQTGQLLPGTMLPLVRPLVRRAEGKVEVESVDGERGTSPMLDLMAGMHLKPPPQRERTEEAAPDASSKLPDAPPPTLDQIEKLALGLSERSHGPSHTRVT